MRFLHWILLLVLIVVVIVARFVISRILNVGHVDESLKSSGRARRAGPPLALLSLSETLFVQAQVWENAASAPSQLIEGQLWASKKVKYDFYGDLRNLGGTGRTRGGW